MPLVWISVLQYEDSSGVNDRDILLRRRNGDSALNSALAGRGNARPDLGGEFG
jgi:hypothetical protein